MMLRRFIARAFTLSYTAGKIRRGGAFSSLIQTVSRTTGGLDSKIWEENYTDVIENQVGKAGNAGQETLLGDDYFGNYAKDYCKDNGEDYDPDKFVSYVKDKLGDDYYYAINEIIDECSQELFEAWDESYRNDGIGEKLFGGFRGSTFFTSNKSLYGNFSNAMAIYSRNAARTYGSNWNTNSAANARSRATATKFLAANPRGIRRNEFVSSQYRAAAARNGKRL